jgi:hypothetical protein
MGTFSETPIVDYHSWFANLGKQLPFYVSVCRLETEVCHPFSFAGNKQKLPFSIISVFHVFVGVCGCVCVFAGSVCV